MVVLGMRDVVNFEGSLLALGAIQARMNEMYVMTGGDVPELAMRVPGMSPDEFNALSHELNYDFDDDFRETVTAYEIGGVSLGGIWFGQGGEYLRCLKRMNIRSGHDEVWWADDLDRPLSYLMIASTDSYIVLLDSENGFVFSFERGRCWHTMDKVADSFSLLIRGAGSLFLRRKLAVNKKALGRNVAKQVGGNMVFDQFWVGLACGYI